MAVFLALVVATAFLAGTFEAGEWYYQKLTRPWWTPPAWVFALAWSGCYVVAALAAWQVWLSGHHGRGGALSWWILLLIMTVGWSALFFGVNRIGWAWLELGATIIVTVSCIRVFRPITRQGGYLMTPYLLWLLFLWTLNLVVWTLNGGPLGRFLA